MTVLEPGALCERGRELAILGDALDGAAVGVASMVLLQGPTGVGKSALLRAAARDAASRGWEPLRASGSELEREVGFSVVRQLFEAAVRDRGELLAGGARGARVLLDLSAGDCVAEPVAIASALFWLCRNWCMQVSPLVLLIDDLHLSDPASSRFLDYLLRRAGELPLAIIGARRPLADPVDGSAGVGCWPEAKVVPVRALSSDGTAELVAELTGARAERAFADACHRAGGGVPFFTEQLVSSAISDGLPLTTVGAQTVISSALPAIRHAIALRLGALGADTVRLSRAVALLGKDADMGTATAVSGLALDRVQRARDTLAAAGFFVPEALAFANPLVLAAVREEIGAGEAAAAHRRIARALDARAAGPERVALHVQLSDPAGEAWAVEKLLAAAGPAFRAGAFESAVALLSRALQEPPDPALVGQVLFELGRAHSAGPDRMDLAVEYLRQAITLLHDEGARARAAVELAIALTLGGAVDAAAEDLQRVAATIVDPAAQARVASMLLLTRMHAGQTPYGDEDAWRLRNETAAGASSFRLISGALAFHAVCAGHDATLVSALARDALLPLASTMASDETPQRQAACLSAALCDDFDLASQAIEHELDAARQAGSPFASGEAYACRAVLAHRQGRTRNAELDARAALERASSAPTVRACAVAVLVRIALSSGLDREAAELLSAHCLDDQVPAGPLLLMVLDARVRVRLSDRRLAAAAHDAATMETFATTAGLGESAALPWRPAAMRVAQAHGALDHAQQLGREQLELTQRFGAPSWQCEALAAYADVAERAEQPELLERTAELARSSGLAHLEASGLIDLGAALRRQGQRRAARARLSDGVALAERLGDDRLRARGAVELDTAGARPRRSHLAGPDALTASELRVAQLAAAGLGNREIAEQLFVTAKTVETHLSHIYPKLDIRSRRELEAQLNGIAATTVG